MRAKGALSDGYHVLTVRLLPEDFAHLQAVQAFREKTERRTVSYTEIVTRGVREQRVGKPESAPRRAREQRAGK